MKTSAAAAFALLPLAALCGAQSYSTTTASFQLIAQTDNATYDGTAFGACHEGAGIEALCAGLGTGAPTYYNQFYLNTSSQNAYPGYAGGRVGVLNVNIPVNGGADIYNQALSFFYSPSTNVVLPLFEPTQPQLVAFDSDDRMNVPGVIDDTVTPPQYGPAQPYYRWFICEQNFEGYTYPVLSWVMGNRSPENPTCVATNVTRNFLDEPQPAT